MIIEKTEALVSIDVNTGKNTGSTDLESTVFQTNMEAAKEIPVQLMLRNLGGIIIIDFIDMALEEDQKEVLRVLQENLNRDRIRNEIVHFTKLGLVEMTRKRVGNPLSSDFLEVCPECGGLGQVKSKGTILGNIFNELKNSTEEKDISTINLYLSNEMHSFIMENYIDFIYSYM